MEFTFHFKGNCAAVVSVQCRISGPMQKATNPQNDKKLVKHSTDPIIL